MHNKSQKKTSNLDDYGTWMHSSIEIPTYSYEKKKEWWKDLPTGVKVIDHLLSKIIKTFKIARETRRHIVFRIFTKFFTFYFKIFNRLKVFGLENVPQKGCIFYVNHPGSYDPLIFWAALRKETGAYMSWMHSWFLDAIDQMYGLMVKHHWEGRQVVVERIIQHLLKKNSYYAIWPESHPNKTGVVEEGYSSIVRAYAAVNAKKDLIPFCPVLIRGSGTYLGSVGINTVPIELHFLKPFYIPREWLEKPKEGGTGKTPREIIDWMMLKIAHAQGQKRLATNYGLQKKKLNYEIGTDNPFILWHITHQFQHIHRFQYKPWLEFNNIYGIKQPPETLQFIPQDFIDGGNIEDYFKECDKVRSNIISIGDMHEEHRYLSKYKCECRSDGAIESIPLKHQKLIDEFKDMPPEKRKVMSKKKKERLKQYHTYRKKHRPITIDKHSLILEKDVNGEYSSYFDLFDCTCTKCSKKIQMCFDFTVDAKMILEKYGAYFKSKAEEEKKI